MKNTKKNPKLKELPEFKTEEEERLFWSKNDSTDYIDWSEAQEAVFPNLKPTTQSISIRLPLTLLDDLKVLANKMDVPYQSLIKIMLVESVKNKYGSA